VLNNGHARLARRINGQEADETDWVTGLLAPAKGCGLPSTRAMVRPPALAGMPTGAPQ
jgi:hypothetical protein